MCDNIIFKTSLSNIYNDMHCNKMSLKDSTLKYHREFTVRRNHCNKNITIKFQKQLVTVLTLIALALSFACETISTDTQRTMKLDMAQGIYATRVGKLNAWISTYFVNACLVICAF